MPMITLSTMPAYFKRDPGRDYSSEVTLLLGASLGSATVEIRTIADVRAAVADFGAPVAAEHPEASFRVFACLKRGARKPNGYDAERTRDDFGGKAWMKLNPKDAAA